MRKVVAGLFVSLDGVATSPADWAFSRYLDTELAQIIAAGVRQADAVLLGRRTYEGFIKIWPSQPDTVPMAPFLNGSPKYVVSSTLQEPLGWAHSTVLRGTLASAVAALKAQPGANIQVPGSPSLVRALLRGGLLDELAISICPILVGKGDRLFDETIHDLKLRVRESRVLGTGVVHAVYEPQVDRNSERPIAFPHAAARS